ncbi:MAG: hypothetical protein KBG63_06895 [Acetobacterium sp.]|nr:hypothetical protein [Acetobacterium sp.]
MDYNNYLPAQDLDAERSLIGSIVTQNSLFDKMRVLPTDFYSKRHENAFRTILGMLSRKEPVDAVTFAHQSKKEHPNGGTITDVDLLKILDESPLLNIEKYMDVIKDCSITRQVKEICYSIIHSDKIGNDILSDAQKGVLGISGSGHEDDIKNVRDIISDHMERIDKANTTEVENFLRFGFPNLDMRLKTSGPKMIVVAGRPGSGKTSFALTAIKNLDRLGVHTGLISIEMPEFEIIDRFLAMESSVTASKFGRYKGLDFKEYQMVNDAASVYYNSNIQIDSMGGVDISDVERKGRRMKNNGAEIIFIDQLSHIGNKDINAGDLTTRYSENTTRLSSLKKELGIPIVLLAQLNRDLKARSNKRPILSDLKQSGKIEEDADAVLFIHRPEEYADNEEEKEGLKGLAIIDIAKNRSGAKYTDKNILFHHETTYFYQG